MLGIEPGVFSFGQVHNPGSNALVKRMCRLPPAIAVYQRNNSLGFVSCQEPPNLAKRQLKDCAALLGGQITSSYPVQDLYPFLFFHV